MHRTPFSELDSVIEELGGQTRRWGLQDKVRLIERAISRTYEVADQWIELAHRAKGIPASSAAAAEDVLTGPLATIRFLRLLRYCFKDALRTGFPRLPAEPRIVDDVVRVPVFPTKWLCDSLFFSGMSAEAWLEEGLGLDEIYDESVATLASGSAMLGVVVVLGAGNVSSIPATDALSKVLLQHHAVVLKMNPVNEYLGPVFERALEPFISEDLLRIVYGGAEEGAHLVEHPSTTSVHITGSIESHDRIVWGRADGEQESRKRSGDPVLQKEITSELSNVTPWAIVPATYSSQELDAIAENIAASITNNASFNCVATKVILTSRGWSQRDDFLKLIQRKFDTTPPRSAYYPGAHQRYQRFSGCGVDAGEPLPWKLIPDADVVNNPRLLTEESFTCVCAEVVLGGEATTDIEFLNDSVDFMNGRLWGTLAASISVSDEFQERHAVELDDAIKRLHYGTVGVNLWSAMAFAWMSPPWGGFPGSTLEDAQSGVGFVHNTYMLRRPQKTVIKAPLACFPKPIWYSTHRHPEKLARRTLALYHRPSFWKLPLISLAAMTG